jgi:hypothetical protein
MIDRMTLPLNEFSSGVLNLRDAFLLLRFHSSLLPNELQWTSAHSFQIYAL